MADQLTSVRFDQGTLDALRVLSDLHDTNVAAEVREAVRLYIRDQTSAPDFEQKFSDSENKRRARVDQVLASHANQH